MITCPGITVVRRHSELLAKCRENRKIGLAYESKIFGNIHRQEPASVWLLISMSSASRLHCLLIGRTEASGRRDLETVPRRGYRRHAPQFRQARLAGISVLAIDRQPSQSFPANTGESDKAAERPARKSRPSGKVVQAEPTIRPQPFRAFG